MTHSTSKGIVLHRINYGEADRIITLLTPTDGKVTLIAKGVRKPKSKLAGGIELFSVSDITYLKGKKDISTLTSARLDEHYGNIITDIDRTMFGYELIKQLHKITEHNVDAEYYNLLYNALQALNDATVDLAVIKAWFSGQLLRLAGHTPNLRTDTEGRPLSAEMAYEFSFDDMTFAESSRAQFSADTIKVLRLLFGDHTPAGLKNVNGLSDICSQLVVFMQNMQRVHLSV